MGKEQHRLIVLLSRINLEVYLYNSSRGSSVSIVSNYGLHGQTVEVGSPA
jgi:hypothetical protein